MFVFDGGGKLVSQGAAIGLPADPEGLLLAMTCGMIAGPMAGAMPLTATGAFRWHGGQQAQLNVTIGQAGWRWVVMVSSTPVNSWAMSGGDVCLPSRMMNGDCREHNR